MLYIINIGFESVNAKFFRSLDKNALKLGLINIPYLLENSRTNWMLVSTNPNYHIHILELGLRTFFVFEFPHHVQTALHTSQAGHFFVELRRAEFSNHFRRLYMNYEVLTWKTKIILFNS